MGGGTQKSIISNPALLMIIGTILTAVNSVYGVIALETMPVFFYVALRFTSIGAVFLGVALWKSERIKNARISDFIVEIILQTLFAWSWLYALTLTEAINSSIFFLLSPIFVYIGSVFALKEPKSSKALLGSLVALVGGLLLFGAPSIGRGDSQAMLGNGLLFLAAFTFALIILHSKKMLETVSRNYILGSRFFFTGIFSCILAVSIDDIHVLKNVSMSSWLALLMSITFGGVIGLAMYYKGLRHMRAEDSASLLYLDPLVGVIAAALVLGETLSSFGLVASSVIVLGITIAHPVHIHRYIYYEKEHHTRFEEFVMWLKHKYSDVEKLLTKVF